LYTSLDSAITQAAAGSTIYLSGGGFQVKDETKITKKITLIGLGHKPDNDNADGNTMVSGNLFFEDGSSGSTLMGIYLSGNVYAGLADASVKDILVRYCNVNSVQVRNSNCTYIRVNQCYLRNGSNGGNSAIRFTNNVMHSVGSVLGGVIDHNVILYNSNATNSRVTNNVLMESMNASGVFNHNMSTSNQGDKCTQVAKWDTVLVDHTKGINPNANYALQNGFGVKAATDSTDIGIYGGMGFSDIATPRMPRIVARKVGEQTNDDGTLHIELDVKTK
jgi:hypothetical protein